MAARLIVPALLLLSGCAAGIARTPAGVVERFYATRLDSQMSGAPTPEELEQVAPYLTDELHDLLEEAGRLRDLEAAAAPDEKPAFADGDLFSSLFEGPTAFRVVGESRKGDTHRVAVHFTYGRGAETVGWEDTVVVVPRGDGFAIDDVEYAGNWDFASTGTLRANLESALAEPRPACLPLVPTTWVVAGHAVPGISAMTDEEADAWDGSELDISREEVTFRDEVCESPKFATKEMPRAEFQDEFRDSPDARDLPPGAVCVTRVSCADDLPMPASVLVHGRSELLLFWDGVWFRARPGR